MIPEKQAKIHFSSEIASKANKKGKRAENATNLLR